MSLFNPIQTVAASSVRDQVRDQLSGFDGIPQSLKDDVNVNPASARQSSEASGSADYIASEIHIGIEEKDRKQIVEGLSSILADTYTLYLRTHNYHWNVTGPTFRSLHLMFEEQYKELAEAVDVIAERIRALGFPAPATYGEFMRMTSIKEENGVVSAPRMIELLCEAQEAVVLTARKLAPLVEELNDLPTQDLLTHRMNIHEKTAWMLRSMLVKVS